MQVHIHFKQTHMNPFAWVKVKHVFKTFRNACPNTSCRDMRSSAWPGKCLGCEQKHNLPWKIRTNLCTLYETNLPFMISHVHLTSQRTSCACWDKTLAREGSHIYWGKATKSFIDGQEVTPKFIMIYKYNTTVDTMVEDLSWFQLCTLWCTANCELLDCSRG